MINRYAFFTLLAALAGLLLASCGASVGSDPSAAPFVYALLSDDNDNMALLGGEGRIFDAGTQVEIINYGRQQISYGNAAVDGTFQIEIEAVSGDLITMTGVLDNVDVEWLTYATIIEDLQDRDLIVTGAAPNRMELADGWLWVANALDNSVTSYNISFNPPAAGATVMLDQYASPADVAVYDGKGYMVTNGTNRLLRFNLLDGSIEQTVDVSDAEVLFPDPYELEVVSGKLFMARSNVTAFGPGATYDPGEIHVYSLPDLTYIDSIETGFANPKFLDPIPGDDKLICSCAGEIDFNAQYEPFAVGDAGLVIIDTVNLSVDASINLGLSGAGDVALNEDSSVAWVGSSLGGYVMKVNLNTETVLRGVGNPIELTDEFTYVPSLVRVGDYLFAASFNTDEIFVIDALTDSVGRSPLEDPLVIDDNQDLFTGIVDMVWYDGGLYALNGIANSITRINLSWVE